MIFVEIARLEPGARLRRHAHRDGHLCLVAEGGFEEKIALRRESCGVDRLRVSRPGTEHDLTAGSAGARCLVVSFPGDLLAAGATGGEPSRFVRAPRAAAAFRAAVGSAGPDRDWLIESALHEILAAVGRDARLRRAVPPPAWLLRVRDRLAAPGTRPEIAWLASEEGVDPCHLARAFRDHFGLAAVDWYRRRRIARARERIAGSREPLAAIALDTGFADQAHLSREFRRYCGTTPAAWRRIMRPTQGRFKTRPVPRAILRP